MLKVSIVISFYNTIEYLRLVLESLENQSFKDFEIIIADDGSFPHVVNEIEQILKTLSYKSIHIWHEDKGFRKNRILNRAILAASTEYLIFIDGDCVLHSKFIGEHYNNREGKICLTGRRVNLSERITNELSPKKIKVNFFQKKFIQIIMDGIFGKSFDVEKGFYFKLNYLRNLVNKKHRGILGCNFSLYKKDIIEINGFDERYEAPSIGEDSDIQFRLELNNVKIKSLNNIAVQYHLYHKLQIRPEKNIALFEIVKKVNNAFTKYGINKP